MRGGQPTACSSTSENHPTTKQRQSLSPLDDGDGDDVDVGLGDEYECWQTITPRNNDSPCHLFASEPTLLSTGSLCDFLQPSSALSTEMIGKKCPPLVSQQFYSTEVPYTRTNKSELLSQFLSKAPVFDFLSTQRCSPVDHTLVKSKCDP